MHLSQIFNVANMCSNAFHANKILANISKFTVDNNRLAALEWTASKATESLT